MKIQPYRLSQISMGDFTIVGYSVAGEESVILVPELDVCFDIGKCPREALTVNHVLLTHGHSDHSVGLLYYFAQRDFQGIRGGVLIVPGKMLDAVENLLHAWGKVDGKTPPYRLEGLADGEDYEIRRNLLARAFKTKHVPGSLGYAVIDVRYKLKEEFAGLSQKEIVAKKNSGVEITNRTEAPLVAYLGDTAKANYSDLPFVRDARALLIECTFFDDEHDSRALAGRHIHVDCLAEVLEGMNNEKIILTHVTRRTNLAQARKLLKQKLPDSLLKRVTFLMSRKHVEEE
jgi:ribonuclease Z